MKPKIEVRFEPLLKFMWTFGFSIVLTMIFGILMSGYILLILFIGLIFLIIELILYVISYYLGKDNVLAVLTEEGCYLGGKRLIKWDEIVWWEYVSGGRSRLNSLEFETEIGNKFEIKGFSYRKMIITFKHYIPEKQKKLGYRKY